MAGAKHAARSKRKAAAKEGRDRAGPPADSSTLSSDWYWEQDENLRFTRVDVRNGGMAEEALAAELIGKKRWETGIEVAGGWDTHRAALDAREPFRDVLMWRTFEDGSRRYVSVSGEPIYDAKRRFRGYHGIGRNITAQKRAEDLLHLEHSVTRSLAEATSMGEGVKATLRAICASERWECGEFWLIDDAAQVARLAHHWSTPGAMTAPAFIERAHEVVFRPGVGLVGAAWTSGEMIWVPDVMADPRVVRKDICAETGLRAALAFPIRSGAEVVAVMDFTCTR